VRDHIEEFRRRGVAVAAVAQGSGAEAQRFCEPLDTGYPCYGDPGKSAYRAFGLGRIGFIRMMVQPFVENPALAWRRLRGANLAGARMRHSDVQQLGGVAILERGGVVRYLHRAQQTDDMPPISELLAEIDRLGLSS
jgi:hypothetical protein